MLRGIVKKTFPETETEDFNNPALIEKYPTLVKDHLENFLQIVKAYSEIIEEKEYQSFLNEELNRVTNGTLELLREMITIFGPQTTPREVHEKADALQESFDSAKGALDGLIRSGSEQITRMQELTKTVALIGNARAELRQDRTLNRRDFLKTTVAGAILAHLPNISSAFQQSATSQSIEEGLHSVRNLLTFVKVSRSLPANYEDAILEKQKSDPFIFKIVATLAFAQAFVKKWDSEDSLTDLKQAAAFLDSNLAGYFNEWIEGNKAKNFKQCDSAIDKMNVHAFSKFGIVIYYTPRVKYKASSTEVTEIEHDGFILQSKSAEDVQIVKAEKYEGMFLNNVSRLDGNFFRRLPGHGMTIGDPPVAIVDRESISLFSFKVHDLLFKSNESAIDEKEAQGLSSENIETINKLLLNLLRKQFSSLEKYESKKIEERISKAVKRHEWIHLFNGLSGRVNKNKMESAGELHLDLEELEAYLGTFAAMNSDAYLELFYLAAVLLTREIGERQNSAALVLEKIYTEAINKHLFEPIKEDESLVAVGGDSWKNDYNVRIRNVIIWLNRLSELPEAKIREIALDMYQERTGRIPIIMGEIKIMTPLVTPVKERLIQVLQAELAQVGSGKATRPSAFALLHKGYLGFLEFGGEEILLSSAREMLYATWNDVLIEDLKLEDYIERKDLGSRLLLYVEDLFQNKPQVYRSLVEKSIDRLSRAELRNNESVGEGTVVESNPVTEAERIQKHNQSVKDEIIKAVQQFETDYKNAGTLDQKLTLIIPKLLINGEWADLHSHRDRIIAKKGVLDLDKSRFWALAWKSRLKLFELFQDQAIRSEAIQKAAEIALQLDRGHDYPEYQKIIDEMEEAHWNEWHRQMGISEVKMIAKYGFLFNKAAYTTFATFDGFPATEEFRRSTIHHRRAINVEAILVFKVPSFLFEHGYMGLGSLVHVGDEQLPQGYLEDSDLPVEQKKRLALVDQLNDLGQLPAGYIDLDVSRELNRKARKEKVITQGQLDEIELLLNQIQSSRAESSTRSELRTVRTSNRSASKSELLRQKRPSKLKAFAASLLMNVALVAPEASKMIDHALGQSIAQSSPIPVQTQQQIESTGVVDPAKRVSNEEDVLTDNALRALAVKGKDLAEADGPFHVVVTNQAEFQIVQTLNAAITPDSRDYIIHSNYQEAARAIKERHHQVIIIGVEEDNDSVFVLKQYADKVIIWNHTIVQGVLAGLEGLAHEFQAAIYFAYSA